MVGSPAEISAAISAAGRVLLACSILVASGASSASDSSAAARARSQAGPSAEWSCRQQICQRVTRRGLELTVELRSERNTSSYVVLTPEGLSNVKTLQAPPFIVRLGPGQTKTAGVLAIQDPDAPHAYQTKWRALSGNPFAVHDDRWHYRMPFGGGKPVAISQGYGGRFSHKRLGAYALDFPMPSGTPVLAARGGTIALVVDDEIASGIWAAKDEDGNRVVIEHVDGTFATYAHLRHGITVRIGQRVSSGEQIGLSGDTGFATGPHLHFEVYRIRSDGDRETIPVRFWNGSKAGFSAQVGIPYAPGCARAGAGRCRPGELASEVAERR